MNFGNFYLLRFFVLAISFLVWIKHDAIADSPIFAPTPLNKVSCSAGVFGLDSKIPTEDIQPYKFELLSSLQTFTWEKKIEKIELKDKYKPFYSPIWIAQDQKSIFATKAFISSSSIENDRVIFTLSRFNQTENRVAGISLQINLSRGYDATYLIDFKNDGYTKKILSPFKIGEFTFALSISCEIENLSE